MFILQHALRELEDPLSYLLVEWTKGTQKESLLFKKVFTSTNTNTNTHFLIIFYLDELETSVESRKISCEMVSGTLMVS